MGESQTFSRRLHEITERRNILSEVERTQRELEQKRISLQQLKRKSLRERWLMDGVVPSPGAEMDNPLFQTESKIQQLEKELESLQMQLLRLENPMAVPPEAKTIQAPFVNGEKIQKEGGQTGGAKEVSTGQAKDSHGIIHEEQATKEDHTLGQDSGTGQAIPAENKANLELNVEHQDIEHQKVESADLNQEHEKLSPEHPVQNQTVQHLEKNQAHLDQEHTKKNQDGQDGILEYLTQGQQLENPNLQHLDRYLVTEVTMEHEKQNLEPGTIQHHTVQHLENTQEHQDQEKTEKNQDEHHGILEHIIQDQQNENPNLGHLDKYLVTEKTLEINPLENVSVQIQNQSTSDHSQNQTEAKLPTDIPQQKALESKTQTTDHVSELVHTKQDHSQEHVTTDQTQGQELFSSSSEPTEEESVSLAQDEKLDQHSESVSTVHEVHDGPSENQKPVITSEDQNHGYMSLSNAQNQDQGSALPEKDLEHTQKPDLSHEFESEASSLTGLISVSTLLSMEQNQESTEETSKSVALDELSDLLNTDMIKQSLLMSKSLEESPSLPLTEQIQETMCQSVFIPDLKKDQSDPEVMQKSSSSEPAPSTLPQSSSAEGNSSPESQPLLQKSQGTDSQQAQGGNTATPPEEDRRVKKKSCHCCVVM
ncbi:paralemmin-3 isoform X2 [Xenopus tropicalis]|nr:paralemmin-3 isoform X2 [Xenopus tropicalis]XP_031755318.1 paralemmin-3 isoform X2 [Xenopus tropicalis]|eukprot:XP_002940662.1 PREDICTED: paralemmin-3 isoform X2 [Xenopus tropicalis]